MKKEKKTKKKINKLNYDNSSSSGGNRWHEMTVTTTTTKTTVTAAPNRNTKQNITKYCLCECVRKSETNESDEYENNASLVVFFDSF